MQTHDMEKSLVRRMAYRSAGRGAVKGWLTGALVVGGVLLLVRHGLRRDMGVWWPSIFLPLLLAGAGAWHALRHNRYPLSAAAALLDARGGCGGLLVAAGLPGWEAWETRCRFPDKPIIRWHEPRLWRMAALASLFAAAVSVWPQRPLVATTSVRRMQLDAEVDRLREQVEILADSLPEDDALQLLTDQLEHLRETALSDAPAEAWEALDLIADRLRTESAEAAEDALNAMRRMEPLVTLAEALRETLARTTPSTELTKALEQLASAIEGWSQQYGELPADELAAALRGSFPEGLFDDALLEQLSSRWDAEWNEHLDRLSQWSEARLIDPALLRFCSNGTDRAAAEAALAACFGGNGDGDSAADALSAWFGVSRGPGAAPLINGEATEDHDAAGAALLVSSVPLSDPDLMRAQGTSFVAPDVEPVAPTSAGRLASAEAGGGAAHRQALLPRHRRIAAAFFNTTDSVKE